MDEVLTIFEARISPDREAALRDAFVENLSGALPEGAIETFLMRAPDVPNQWAILTRWASTDDLDRYRATADPPREAMAFRGALAEPTATVYEVYRAEEANVPRR